MENIKDLYFRWLCLKVSCSKQYENLLLYLHSNEFTYTIGLDGNREADGIDLRYRFGDEAGFSHPMIAENLDNAQCSILEMMVALSIRCEEHIMTNADLGDRTGIWFWGMIDNLGLKTMTNQFFNEERAGIVLERLLERKYSANGRGGLFTVNNGRDLRTVEIWYQMCWYLSEHYKGE